MEQSKRCTKDVLQAGGALTQLRPESAPHQVHQYFVIKRSKFSQLKAHAHIPCLFCGLTDQPSQGGHKSPLAGASQQGSISTAPTKSQHKATASYPPSNRLGWRGSRLTKYHGASGQRALQQSSQQGMPHSCDPPGAEGLQGAVPPLAPPYN